MIINAGLGRSDHELIQLKTLWGARKISRTLQTGLKPRVYHPWSTWLPCTIITTTTTIWLSLWMRGNSRRHFPHLKPGFQNWHPKNPFIQVQKSLYYNLGKWTTRWINICCCMVKLWGKEVTVILHLEAINKWSTAGVCNETCLV